MTLLTVKDICVHDGGTQLVEPLSITLEPGAPLVILGETGSGKSLFAQAIMGTLPTAFRHAGTSRSAGAGSAPRGRTSFAACGGGRSPCCRKSRGCRWTR